MTEKRFKLIYINEQHISANLYDDDIFIGSIENGEELIVEVLNQLSEENKQLKEQVSEQGTQIDFLEDENTHMRNVLNENKQLKEEIEQLKQSNERLLKMLDNIANYMQKENKYMPIDDFVEWWNNIATKGLDGDVE